MLCLCNPTLHLVNPTLQLFSQKFRLIILRLETLRLANQICLGNRTKANRALRLLNSTHLRLWL